MRIQTVLSMIFLNWVAHLCWCWWLEGLKGRGGDGWRGRRREKKRLWVWYSWQVCDWAPQSPNPRLLSPEDDVELSGTLIKVPKVTVLDLRSYRHSHWAIRSIALGCLDYSVGLINYLTAAWKHSNTWTLSNGITVMGKPTPLYEPPNNVVL